MIVQLNDHLIKHEGGKEYTQQEGQDFQDCWLVLLCMGMGGQRCEVFGELYRQVSKINCLYFFPFFIKNYYCSNCNTSQKKIVGLLFQVKRRLLDRALLLAFH